MRDILFRGKRTDTNKWEYGAYLPVHKMICIERTYPNSTEYMDFFVEPETVGQFIDCTDKNGAKIFEGDVVKGKVHMHGGYRVRKGVIVYYIDAFKMKVGSDYKEIPSPCEIIGNIYDNPGLLEE